MSEPKRSLPQPEPWMHEDPRPKDGAPDVIMIVLDDLGFAQLGAFGSDIATPNMTVWPRAGCGTTVSM